MKFLDILVVSLVGGFALVLFVWLVIQAHKWCQSFQMDVAKRWWMSWILLALVIHSALLWWTQDKELVVATLMGGFVLSSLILYILEDYLVSRKQGRQ